MDQIDTYVLSVRTPEGGSFELKVRDTWQNAYDVFQMLTHEQGKYGGSFAPLSLLERR